MSFDRKIAWHTPFWQGSWILNSAFLSKLQENHTSHSAALPSDDYDAATADGDLAGKVPPRFRLRSIAQVSGSCGATSTL